MTAKNKLPLFSSFNGRTHPIFVWLYVQAGATQEIKQGEICKLRSLDFDAYPIIPASENDADFFPLIAWESQSASDPARCIQFAVPAPGDLFEFDLNAATDVGWGDGISLAGSQRVKKDSAYQIACAWGEYTDSGVARTVSRVNVEFLRVAVTGLELLPILNAPQQIGS